MSIIRKYYQLIATFVALVAVYLYTTLNIAASDPIIKNYHATLHRAQLLSLSVALPFIIIWAIAMFGAIRLRSYAAAIRKSKDGRAFYVLSRGIIALWLFLPINAVVSGLVKIYLRHYPHMAADGQRVSTYVSIVILLVAFYLLAEGATRLASLTKNRPPNWLMQLAMALFIAFVAIYSFFVFHDTSHQDVAFRHFPDTVLLATVVIPRLIMWFWGFQAVWNIVLYARNVKGEIYKHSLNIMATGLAVVTLSLISAGYLSTMSSLSKVNLTAILEIVYLLLAVMALGYIFIARGAQSLSRIENI